MRMRRDSSLPLRIGCGRRHDCRSLVIESEGGNDGSVSWIRSTFGIEEIDSRFHTAFWIGTINI